MILNFSCNYCTPVYLPINILMKLLIFGSPRTRTSYLLDVLCQHYNIKNFREPYTGQLVTESRNFEIYKSKNKEVTNNLKDQDNFGLKIFTDALIDWDFFRENADYRKLTKQSIMDIYDIHNLNMYDQIYITYRKNSVDRFCSFTRAFSQNKFIFRKGQENSIKFYSPKNVNLEYSYQNLKVSLLTDILHNQLSKEIMQRKHNAICLEYDEIKNFVTSNYPNIESQCVESFYDYKNTLKNYNQICDDFDKAKLELEQEGAIEVVSTLFN